MPICILVARLWVLERQTDRMSSSEYILFLLVDHSGQRIRRFWTERGWQEVI